jgi:hypothetical protein
MRCCRLTERYCVVLQSLLHSPDTTVSYELGLGT